MASSHTATAGSTFPVGEVVGGALGALAAFIMVARRRPKVLPHQLHQLVPLSLLGPKGISSEDKLYHTKALEFGLVLGSFEI